ncbi:CGNR zinc finger domain-containing protein [Adhaeribacter swui]|uniref:CGNR zinc finger domain-containing protein n=1 Tax=Adhaeribacter swui TaxID=2086471 RepID=A0A7G7G810_9BACT|nr:CGNR zinc finger domain-containing protein [Adhaeribacter swui]QNF33294.1 CGNR zinc finger domain-containing protein [Adhaeribacter swui]
MAHQNTIETIPFDGGVLCLDFVNTVRNRKVPRVHNYFASYANFLIWCRRVAILPVSVLDDLQEYSSQNPVEAEAALQQIVAVRENLYLLFSAIAAERVPTNAVTATFNQNLSNAMGQVFLAWQNTIFSFQLQAKEKELTGPVKLILYSAYQTLLREDRRRIKECAECGWLFLDKTKNGKRQWCNPIYCGSTSKSRRYYHRQKEKEQNSGEA